MATRYKRILIAVDGSDDADQVLEGAIELDRKSAESFYVMTVIPPERVTVLYGRPAAEINAHAEQVRADLIVVGSHGRQGMSRVMLGSTANGVLHGATCDVLTIRIRE